MAGRTARRTSADTPTARDAVAVHVALTAVTRLCGPAARAARSTPARGRARLGVPARGDVRSVGFLRAAAHRRRRRRAVRRLRLHVVLLAAFRFPHVAGLAENAASMQRTIRRGFPESASSSKTRTRSTRRRCSRPAAATTTATTTSTKALALRRRSTSALCQPCRQPPRSRRCTYTVYGGIPCQPIAPSGAERGVDDPRIGDTADALPRAARALDANSADAENQANIVAINDQRRRRSPRAAHGKLRA